MSSAAARASESAASERLGGTRTSGSKPPLLASVVPSRFVFGGGSVSGVVTGGVVSGGVVTGGVVTGGVVVGVVSGGAVVGGVVSGGVVVGVVSVVPGSGGGVWPCTAWGARSRAAAPAGVPRATVPARSATATRHRAARAVDGSVVVSLRALPTTQPRLRAARASAYLAAWPLLLVVSADRNTTLSGYTDVGTERSDVERATRAGVWRAWWLWSVWCSAS